MKLNLHFFAASLLASVFCSCQLLTEQVIVTPLPVSELPKDVASVIAKERPDFVPAEVQKKVRGERTYYDVEGEASGAEIEFDVLMTEEGPQIVEIQRDLTWSQVPNDVRNTYDQKTKAAEPVRIIESVQTDQSIIYEFFLEGKPADPSFEIQTANGSPPKLLKERAEH